MCCRQHNRSCRLNTAVILLQGPRPCLSNSNTYFIFWRRYRTAMTKLRSSSHTLEIERGRYTKHKTDICERLCPLWNAMEDKIHFLVNCKIYEAERLRFFSKLVTKIRNFSELDDVEKFILLMSSEDNQIVTWTGKFIYKSFNIRSRFYLNCGGT